MKRLFLFLSVLLCIFLVTESMADVVSICVTDRVAVGREGEVFSSSTTDEFWDEEGSSTFSSGMDESLYKLQYTAINGVPTTKSTSVTLNHADYIGVSSINITFMWKQRTVTPVDPPAEDPPAEDPPAEDPPAEDPPAEDPPAEDPPAEDPPSNPDPVVEPEPSNPEPSYPEPSNPDPVIPDPVIPDPVVEPEPQPEPEPEQQPVQEKKEEKKEEKQEDPIPLVIVPADNVNEQPITYSAPDIVEVYVEPTPTPTPKKTSKKKKKAKATPTPVPEKRFIITILDENMKPVTASIDTNNIGADGMMIWMEELGAYLAVETR